jgi:hypothetical protein
VIHTNKAAVGTSESLSLLLTLSANSRIRLLRMKVLLGKSSCVHSFILRSHKDTSSTSFLRHYLRASLTISSRLRLMVQKRGAQFKTYSFGRMNQAVASNFSNNTAMVSVIMPKVVGIIFRPLRGTLEWQQHFPAPFLCQLICRMKEQHKGKKHH